MVKGDEKDGCLLLAERLKVMGETDGVTGLVLGYDLPR